jgi:hypothetical protein
LADADQGKDDDRSLPRLDLDLVREAGLLDQRFRESNPSRIADANETGLHGAHSEKRVHIVITLATNRHFFSAG